MIRFAKKSMGLPGWFVDGGYATDVREARKRERRHPHVDYCQHCGQKFIWDPNKHPWRACSKPCTDALRAMVDGKLARERLARPRRELMFDGFDDLEELEEEAAV